MTFLPPTIPHVEISRLAFQIWQENGRRAGMADYDWRMAERELVRQREHKDLTGSQDAQDATD